jgi:hypothetical protein
MQHQQLTQSGFGDADARFRVYLGNRPPMAEYAELATVTALQRGEIALINQACGNGWRKVFNVYAKLRFALDKQRFSYSAATDSWQQYRDQHLLQAGSDTALLFSPPVLSSDRRSIHIIAGRTYAKRLLDNDLTIQLNWLNNEFAIESYHRVIVCPYFDYRQLNNEKLSFLAQLIKELDETP